MSNSREIIGWEIVNKKVVGLKFFTINYIDKKYIIASYEDKRGRHQLKFSAKTGKQWRIKPWWDYYHLENRKVIRNEKQKIDTEYEKSIKRVLGRN